MTMTRTLVLALGALMASQAGAQIQCCDATIALHASSGGNYTAGAAPTPMPTKKVKELKMCEDGGAGAFYSPPGSPFYIFVKMGPFKIVVYFLGMLWSFLAVGIIADVFMAAIEVITSAEKTIKHVRGDGTTEEIQVKVWNATVANLTLMALGSSAPEILLSVYEILMGDFMSGELGPSTIVGSAAFNLLVIIAVCVMGIPEGEDRKIADMGVFRITAVSSVFAYLWLMVILMVFSADIVELWEALLTFLFFPMLVAAAYGADKNWFRESKVSPQQHVIQIGQKHYRPGEAVELLKKIDTNGLSEDEVTQVMAALAFENKQKPSRAQLRMQAVRSMTGQKRVVPPKPRHVDIKYKTEESKGPAHPRVFFGDVTGAICTKYAVLESEPHVQLTVLRDPPKGKLSVHYETVDGTAKAGSDFEAQKGDLNFSEGEHFKTITIKIFDDDEVEEDEHFSVKLSEVEGCPLNLVGCEQSMTCNVTIIDDDEPGEVGYLEEHVNITVEESKGVVEVPVTRQNGSSGVIKVKYYTKDGTAVAGRDYSAMTDEVEFQRGEITKLLRIPITMDQRYECDETFEVHLEFVSGPPRAALCERHVAYVRIISDEKTKELCDKVAALVNLNVDKYKVGTSNWSQQFKDALTVGGGDDDGGDDGPPGTAALVMHYITLPWKLLYALVPPTDYGGGWVCFIVALMFIGMTTIFIADLASYFGCSINMKDSVTAITFVALGTSLPDTFASKAAAIGDDSADAAVGNVTGSNSVNVFLGLGLPWLIAALYWTTEAGGETGKELWDAKYGCELSDGVWLDGTVLLGTKNFAKHRPNSANQRLFAVPSGDLGFSVGVFSLCAITCLLTLVYRRKAHGAELGGEPGPAKKHGMFFISLWFFYVAMSWLSVEKVFPWQGEA